MALEKTTDRTGKWPEAGRWKKILVALCATGALLAMGFTICFFQILAQKIPAAAIQQGLMQCTAYLLKTGIVLTLLILIPSNILCIKSQKRSWLLLPYLGFTIIALLYGLLQEQIFIFRKATGLWSGEFSVSLFISLIYTLIAFLMYLLNRLILLWILKRQVSN